MAFGTIVKDTFNTAPGALHGRVPEIGSGTWNLHSGSAAIVADGVVKLAAPGPAVSCVCNIAGAAYAVADQRETIYGTMNILQAGDEAEIGFFSEIGGILFSVRLVGTVTGVNLYLRSRSAGSVYLDKASVTADEVSSLENMPFGTFAVSMFADYDDFLQKIEGPVSIVIGGVSKLIGVTMADGLLSHIPSGIALKGDASIGMLFFGNGDGYDDGDSGPVVMLDDWWRSLSNAMQWPG